jgi:hypothetical protein
MNKEKNGIVITCLKCGKLMRPDFSNRTGAFHIDFFDFIHEAFRCPVCNLKVTTLKDGMDPVDIEEYRQLKKQLDKKYKIKVNKMLLELNHIEVREKNVLSNSQQRKTKQP